MPTRDFVQHLCEHARMQWDDLQYALAVSREGTLTGAAERLGVSHTTVSRRLRALEDALGSRLFEGGPDGYRPTEAGRELIEVAARVETDLLAVKGRVLGHDARVAGPIRVTMMELIFRGLREDVGDFVRVHDGVEVTVAATDDELSLGRREADVAFRLTNTPPETLVGRRIGAMQFAAYASRDLVARVGQGAPLGAYPWILWDERLDFRWLDAWLAQNAPGVTVAMRVDVSNAAMHELIAAGIGVQFLACLHGDADPALVRVGPLEPYARRDLWVLTLPELRKSPRVRAFIDFMEPRIRAWLAGPCVS